MMIKIIYRPFDDIPFKLIGYYTRDELIQLGKEYDETALKAVQSPTYQAFFGLEASK